MTIATPVGARPVALATLSGPRQADLAILAGVRPEDCVARDRAAVAGMRPADVRPVWLRPAALTVVVALHVCTVLFSTLPRADVSASVDSIEITIAQGAPEEPPPPPEAKPEPPPPELPPEPPIEIPPPVVEPPLPPPPEPLPPIVADPPKRVVRDAPVIAPRPKVQPPRPKPPEPVTAAAPPAPEIVAPGAPEAAAQLAQARATYAGKVLQEVRRHQITAIGLGSVVVSFVVDADGNPALVTIARSSGKDALDSAALRMVRAIHPGSPPDGRFEGTTIINFVE